MRRAAVCGELLGGSLVELRLLRLPTVISVGRPDHSARQLKAIRLRGDRDSGDGVVVSDSAGRDRAAVDAL